MVRRARQVAFGSASRECHSAGVGPQLRRRGGYYLAAIAEGDFVNDSPVTKVREAKRLHISTILILQRNGYAPGKVDRMDLHPSEHGAGRCDWAVRLRHVADCFQVVENTRSDARGKR